MIDYDILKAEALKLATWENVELDRVNDHDPKWHEFGILGHIKRVFENAIIINKITGIDIVKIALWHDIGKFIVREEKSDKPGEFSFKGHEKASESYLREKFFNLFDSDELFLILNHGSIRGSSTVDEIVNLCNHNKALIQKLVLICAADISGKGFTIAQKEQRIKISEKFILLARRCGLDESFINDIILNW
jgi:hypothetical protein